MDYRGSCPVNLTHSQLLQLHIIVAFQDKSAVRYHVGVALGLAFADKVVVDTMTEP